jgi:hypothetical protein
MKHIVTFAGFYVGFIWVCMIEDRAAGGRCRTFPVDLIKAVQQSKYRMWELCGTTHITSHRPTQPLQIQNMGNVLDHTFDSEAKHKGLATMSSTELVKYRTDTEVE